MNATLLRHRSPWSLALGGAWILASLGCTPPAASVAPPPSKDPSLFEVPAAQQSRLQIVTVAKQSITRPLRVPAVVAFDDLKTTQVVPLVTGRVEKVLVREGDRVKAGQLLLTIASPDSSDNAANLRRDRATLENKKVVLTRDQDLYAHKALSLEELQGAQLDVTSAEATLEDDEAHVSIAGTGVGHADLRSPISGVVVARHVSVGQAVQAGGDPVLTVTDLSRVWVVAHVYPEDVRRVAVGDSALLHSAALDTPLNGQVTYLGAAIDADTLTVPIRVEAENKGGVLKAGLYLDAEISPATKEEVELVPTAAVLRDSDNLPFVYLESHPGQFARRHVTLGDLVGDQLVIRDGLAPGERVLASGALFIQFADSLEH